MKTDLVILEKNEEITSRRLTANFIYKGEEFYTIGFELNDTIRDIETYDDKGEEVEEVEIEDIAYEILKTI